LGGAELAAKQRIGIFRALYLGDLLCAIPAARALRSAFPGGEITLIGLAWAAEFARRFGKYFDDFLEFPPHPALHAEAPGEWHGGEFLDQSRAQPFDLLLQMQGDGSKANEIIAAMNARTLAGFEPKESDPGVAGYFFPYPEGLSEVERNLELMRQLGIRAGSDRRLEFPLTTSDETECAAALEAAGGVGGAYAVIHPGAKLASRRWPAARFAKVAVELAREGLEVVVTGSAGERPLAEEVVGQVGHRALNVAGGTSLGAFGALVSHASLVVTNDTSTSHIAAALEVPSVVIASGSDVERWAPANRELHRVLWADVECRPCGFDVCPIGHVCAEEIDVEMVLAEAWGLLAGEKVMA